MSIDLAIAVAQAFSTVGARVAGVIRSATYTSISGAQTYDPTTGLMTSASTNYLVSVIMTAYSRKEKEVDFQSSRRQAVEFGDMKCLIPFAKLPIAVTLEDTILEGAMRWRIVDHKLDPTGTALHTFQLRQA